MKVNKGKRNCHLINNVIMIESILEEIVHLIEINALIDSMSKSIGLKAFIWKVKLTECLLLGALKEGS
jgi:hypothetical protein